MRDNPLLPRVKDVLEGSGVCFKQHQEISRIPWLGSMKESPVKNTKSLSDKIRSRFSTPLDSGTLADSEEKARIRAIADGIQQNEISTIARVMSEGGNARSRGSALVHRILELVEEKPGCDVHELARLLGEKNIVILSHVDDIIREGVLFRLEDGRLYRSRDFLPHEAEAEAADPTAEQNAAQRLECSRIYLRVFRFLTSQLELEPQCGPKMMVNTVAGKFFEMKAGRGCVHVSMYGMYPRELVDRFKRESSFDRRKINYSGMTGIIDIRGCRYKDIEELLRWVTVFYQASLNSARVLAGDSGL